MTGEPDFVLIVVTPSIVDFEECSRKMLREDPEVSTFTTLIALDARKAGDPLPISLGAHVKRLRVRSLSGDLIDAAQAVAFAPT